MRLGHADVPLARDVSERFLPWLVTLLVYLAALALASALVMQKVVQRWDRGLSGHVTVQLPPPSATATGTERAARIDRVIEVLVRAPGVKSAAHYDSDEIYELLEPWLGSAVADQDLPLPDLIAVTVDPDRPPDLKALARKLHEAVPGTLLDDHQRWLGHLLHLVLSIQAVAVVIFVLVGLSAVLAVIFVTRTGLSIHRQVIELLHLIGAHDAYIAKQFQRHALKLGLRGGAIGLGLALATILPVGYYLGRVQSENLPVLSLSLLEWGLLALLPLVTALVAMITARLTVISTLARMP